MKLGKKIQELWNSFYFAKMTFKNLLLNFLPDINFRKRGEKVAKIAKVYAHFESPTKKDCESNFDIL